MRNLTQETRKSKLLRKAEIDRVVAADQRSVDVEDVARQHGYSPEVAAYLKSFAERCTRSSLQALPVDKPLPAKIRVHARLFRPVPRVCRSSSRTPRRAARAPRRAVRRAVRRTSRAGPKTSDPAPEPPEHSAVRQGGAL